MTGAQLYTFVKRRLAENGFTVPDERKAELLECINTAIRTLRQVFAEAAPIVVQTPDVVLTVDAIDSRKYTIPAASKDPLRILRVREVDTDADLDPSSALNQDLGHYVWQTTRQLRITDNFAPSGGIKVDVVLDVADVDDTTAEAGIALPTPCHQAVGYYAAVLALTADEESDAANAVKLFAGEMDRLEKMYGEYDVNGGLALRNAMLASIGGEHGDMLT